MRKQIDLGQAGFGRALFLFVMLVFLFSQASCQIFQMSAEALQSLVSRGSCISVDIPPITLTPERTAAERQLIGEDREIEKDGWLIASSQSSVPYEQSSFDGGDESNAGKSEVIRRLYQERSVLEFYEQLVQDYKAGGLLGESYTGELLLVPKLISPRQGRFAKSEIVGKARIVVAEVNQSRNWVYQYRRKSEMAKSVPDLLRVEQDFRLRYRNQARTGEWILDEDGEWLKLR